ncbi:MAG: hypothetical protein P8M72_03470 [Gammaproteobacteria bacterium]|nr:hypothetical protein [Gammaproteobacteria bacterium]
MKRARRGKIDEQPNIFEIPVKLTQTKHLLTLFLAIVFMPVFVTAAENEREGIEIQAQRALRQDSGVNNLAPQPNISRRQALDLAGDRYEGSVLGIVLDSSSNNWRVRMDSDGTVFNVFINANSGNVSDSSD